MDLSPPLGPTQVQPQPLWSPRSSHRGEGKRLTAISWSPLTLPPVTLDGQGAKAWDRGQKMVTYLDTP